jgi:LmbE family N-acetylglucosaminyl deacetylase
MSQPIEGSGTPEQLWSAWGRLRTLPALALAGCSTALVVAPHPDDEVLGAGGVLVELRRRGCEISVLALTDGEASHPGAPIAPAALAARRAAESEHALRELLGGCPIDRLGLPDGDLGAHEIRIRRAVEQRLAPAAWCFAPLRQDGHPDHEAAARATARACAQRGARLIEYPIWMWHWSAPGDARVPWERARRARLTRAARARKSRAIAAFASQIAPISSGAAGQAILPPAVLERFLRPSEVLFT